MPCKVKNKNRNSSASRWGISDLGISRSLPVKQKSEIDKLIKILLTQSQTEEENRFLKRGPEY